MNTQTKIKITTSGMLLITFAFFYLRKGISLVYLQSDFLQGILVGLFFGFLIIWFIYAGLNIRCRARAIEARLKPQNSNPLHLALSMTTMFCGFMLTRHSEGNSVLVILGIMMVLVSLAANSYLIRKIRKC